MEAAIAQRNVLLTRGMQRPSSAVVLLALAACATVGRTREEEDRRDSMRVCPVARVAALDSLDYAGQCAEWFVVAQGYASPVALADTMRLAPEGIEYAVGRAGWLSTRQGTLRPEWLTVCRSGRSEQVLVAIARASNAGEARVVTLFLDGRGLRMQHSDWNPEWADIDGVVCLVRPSARSDGEWSGAWVREVSGNIGNTFRVTPG